MPKDDLCPRSRSQGSFKNAFLMFRNLKKSELDAIQHHSTSQDISSHNMEFQPVDDSDCDSDRMSVYVSLAFDFLTEQKVVTSAF